jgi:hypothetical protein
VPVFDELDALSAGFVQSLQALTDLFATRSIRSVPELRQLYRAVEHRLIELDAPQSIGLHLDELVNAIDTAAHLADLLTPALND